MAKRNELRVAYRAVGRQLRKRHLYVESLPGEGVLLRDSAGLAAVLTPIEVGRLRGALREQVLASAWPDEDPDAPPTRRGWRY